MYIYINNHSNILINQTSYIQYLILKSMEYDPWFFCVFQWGSENNINASALFEHFRWSKWNPRF